MCVSLLSLSWLKRNSRIITMFRRKFQEYSPGNAQYKGIIADNHTNATFPGVLRLSLRSVISILTYLRDLISYHFADRSPIPSPYNRNVTMILKSRLRGIFTYHPLNRDSSFTNTHPKTIFENMVDKELESQSFPQLSTICLWKSLIT